MTGWEDDGHGGVKLRIVDMEEAMRKAQTLRLVCPICYADTAGGWCAACGFDWCDGLSDWLIRPRNDLPADEALGYFLEEPSPRRNTTWRRLHRKRGGLRCAWCDVTEVDAAVSFEVDHVEALVDGGDDAFENTRVLCKPCHQLRHTMVAHTRRLREQRRRDRRA